jgi:hypothetical protein
MGALLSDFDHSKKIQNPGPGQYDLMNRQKAGTESAPSFGIQKGSRFDPTNQKSHGYKPGPGNYERDSTIVLNSSP